MKKPSNRATGKAVELQAAKERLEQLRIAAKAARKKERLAKARLKEAHKAAKRTKKAAKAAKAELKAAKAALKDSRRRPRRKKPSPKPVKAARAKARKPAKVRQIIRPAPSPDFAPPGDEAQITPSATSVDIASGGAPSSPSTASPPPQG
jgi:hypothetical protein